MIYISLKILQSYPCLQYWQLDNCCEKISVQNETKVFELTTYLFMHVSVGSGLQRAGA